MKGIGGHQRAYEGRTDEWLTPPEIITALGPFDLDPCSPINRPWPTAAEHFTVEDNGLHRRWEGRVWLNPPYGPETGTWLGRLAEHGNGIALIFARTETEMFFRYGWERADAMLFLRGRLHFHYVDGSRAKANAGGPSVLIAYGKQNVEALKLAGMAGRLVKLSGDRNDSDSVIREIDSRFCEAYSDACGTWDAKSPIEAMHDAFSDLLRMYRERGEAA